MRRAGYAFVAAALAVALVLLEIQAGSSAYQITVLLVGLALICGLVVLGERRGS